MAGALHLPPVSRIEPGGSRVFGMQAWGLCKIGSLRTVDKWPLQVPDTLTNSCDEMEGGLPRKSLLKNCPF